MRATRTFIALACAAASAACGGKDEPQKLTPSPAQVYPVYPATVTQTLNVGDRAYFPTFGVPVGGSAEAFQGKQLYVGVHDSGGAAESVAYGMDGVRTLLFQVKGSVLSSLAPLAGTLSFHVCFDAACTEELPGSPAVATYTFTMAPGLVLDAPDVVELAADFGEDPAPVDLPLTLPVNLEVWQVWRTSCVQTYTTQIHLTYGCEESALLLPLQQDLHATTLRVDPWLGSPGVYEDELEVRAYTNLGLEDRLHTRRLKLRYTIRDQGGPDAIFYTSDPLGGRTLVGPEGLVVETGVGSQVDPHLGWFTKGAQLFLGDAVYDTAPAGADPLAPYGRWCTPWAPGFATCDVFQQHCLAPGTYHAVVTGVVQGPGAHVSLPATLKLQPRP